MFELRKRLVDDFREYITSFINIRDDGIRSFLEEELDRGALWPEPLLQLNPRFQTGGLVDNLIENGTLDPRCGTIFRLHKSDENPSGEPMRLFRHQVEAIQAAASGHNIVLTTGTGSGKSLCYMVPIIDRVLRDGPGGGIRAVVVYPMNALANSQMGELEKYLGFGPHAGVIRFERYTGQEDAEKREQIAQNPPDILLTNFVMLELLLTRPYERRLVRAMSNLRFVVLDELHTYRGRQGADVALLMRRLKDASGSRSIQFIGTSATMATEGSAIDRRRAVAGVATRIFGSEVGQDCIIGETLERYSPEQPSDSDAWRKRLRRAIESPDTLDAEGYRTNPLTVWLESEVGLERDDEGRLVRRPPATLSGPSGVAERLAAATGVTAMNARNAIENHLLAGQVSSGGPKSGPVVFRLHQFFSPGIGLFVSIATAHDRFLSLDGQRSAPDDPASILFPLCFCRVCGQHYYIATRECDEAIDRLVPRDLWDKPRDDGRIPGFLYLPPEGEEVDVDRLIPEDWLEDFHGRRRVRRNRKEYLPQPVSIGPDGTVGAGIDAWFIPQRFLLCMNPECRASYGPRESDITKLSVLGMQGRSTATTTLALSTLGYLNEQGAEAKKLLSFTDNRQDASLQAGHLNDFVEVGMLRAAIRSAAEKADPEGLTYDKVTLEVERELDLAQEDYAQQVSQMPTQIGKRREALRDVLGYRIYRDLRRGWRINAPNLEQVGLLEIAYPDLSVLCSSEQHWQGHHEVLLGASVETRERVCRELLERLRRRLAINVNYLEPNYQEGIRQRSSQLLKQPWGLDEDEARRMDAASYAWTSSTEATDDRTDVLLTPRSGFAAWLRQPGTLPHLSGRLSESDTGDVILDLVDILVENCFLRAVCRRPNATAYQLNAEVMVWRARKPGEEHRRTQNRFFERFYLEKAARLRGIQAREHTAQVCAAEREIREDLFRKGELPILFCSPTMELGVDIADLTVVNLRNVPPTPANYAQRSGRAGRSGQPAMVFTYCTAGSPHDQYYFRRPEQMVSGSVAPPRLDICNEDLIRSHVQAIWLSEAGIDLGDSLAANVLRVEGDHPSLDLTDEIKDALHNQAVRMRALERARAVLEPIRGELATTRWFTDRWLDDVVGQIPLAFDKACERWRNLYRSALEQAERQDRVIRDAASSNEDRRRAESLRREAEQQLAILRESGSQFNSDFYPYRYFASEGFLPGYNFPRLPLSAYVPGRSGRDEYLSRPRFVAISEFGPGAVVYHEGSRYTVDRVILPSSARAEDGKLVLLTAKLCGSCGYLHSGDAAHADICNGCGEELGDGDDIPNLMRLEAVSLRRRDRITCDEEERMRQGYEMRTAIRFSGAPGNLQCHGADVLLADGNRIACLTFAPTATIWRINLGWKRRQNQADVGYQIDTDRGKWLSDKAANELMQEDPDEPALHACKVVPFVEDRKNALIFKWTTDLSVAEYAGLQAALKTAIQTVYQLEDSELAAEPLPTADKRNCLLFYESAEGGAGVLRQLVDDPAALAKVAQNALDLCHFDPDTLEDKRRHPRAAEDCSTACYDCLMSYTNQHDHKHLDRHLVRDLLGALRDARVEASPVNGSRSEHLQTLLAQCESDLERQWLIAVEERGLTLPTYAQYWIPECGTRPDFVYVHGANKLAVYVDGPPHDYPARQMRDADQEFCLMTMGWMVQRFHHAKDWDTLFAQYPAVYGGER
jgi:superfamily II DNA/RNA helicase